MDESIRQLVLSGNQQFQDAIEALTGRVQSFSQEVDALTAIVNSMVGEFNNLTSGLAPSVSALHETIDDRFLTAVSRQSAHIESMNLSMQQLRETADGMSQGSSTVNATLQGISQLTSQTRAAHDALAQAANKLTEVVAAMGVEPAAQARVAMQHAITTDEISSSLEQLTKGLSEFVSQGIEPATQRLAVLHDTLADFEDAIDASYDDGDAAPNDGVNDPHSRMVDSNSQRGFMSWLSRRPR
jgi:uncharacterized phage infection (PIP) family protein YhgE